MPDLLSASARRLGALLAASLALGCPQRPAPPPPSPPSAQAREVPVASEPPGAEVVVGGLVRCLTPCTIRLDPGAYRVVLRKTGFMPTHADILVDAAGGARVQASLVAAH